MKSIKVKQNETSKPLKPLILKRQWIVFFCFSGCFIMFFLRYNLSVAIVAIADEKIECPLDAIRPIDLYNSSIYSTNDSSVTCYQKKYNYDKYMSAQFLAAYFYGMFKKIEFNF